MDLRAKFLKARLLSLIYVLIVSGCAPYSDTPSFIHAAFIHDSQEQKQGDLTVRISAPSPEESYRLFGIDFEGKGIRPIWVEVRNCSNRPFWLSLPAFDSHYYSPLEAAFLFHKWHGVGNKKIDKKIQELVAFMILGQGMESSAGDPSRAGAIRSEFVYDPFVAGNKADHANRLYDILKKLPHMKYFLLNTGGIGEGERYLDIKLDHTIGILDSLFRGGLEDWMESVGGLEVPAAVRMGDDIYFHPEIMYPRAVFDAKLAELNKFRKKAIADVGPGLYPAIKKVFK